jgi:hypothetical protein
MAAIVSIDAALRDARLFRGGRALLEHRDGLPTGIAALDDALPWGGFPRGALSELLHRHDGIGEMSLLLPALRRLAASERVALIAPPYLPYPPALVQDGLPLSQLVWLAPPAERVLWTAEQCLRAGCLGGVLLWSPTGDDRALRRLQLAAEQGGAHAWLFRPLRHATNASPAALRLQVDRHRLQVLKCRGAVVRGDFERQAAHDSVPAEAGRGQGDHDAHACLPPPLAGEGRGGGDYEMRSAAVDHLAPPPAFPPPPPAGEGRGGGSYEAQSAAVHRLASPALSFPGAKTADAAGVTADQLSAPAPTPHAQPRRPRPANASQLSLLTATPVAAGAPPAG